MSKTNPPLAPGPSDTAGPAPPAAVAAAVLYTIGYEGALQTAVLEALLFNDVQTLVDIRELPQSRRPGFSKRALGEAAAAHGIGYVHVRALGTPRDVRHRHRADRDPAAFREGYLAHLADQGDAMAALVERARSERCCLLCFEADPRQCHRWFVAERAQEMAADGGGPPLEVVHLDGPGISGQPGRSRQAAAASEDPPVKPGSVGSSPSSPAPA